MITSVLQYAINVLGVGTFLLVSGSPKTTIYRRLQHGRCGGSGSAFTAKVTEPRHLQCSFCDSELNSLDQLYDCIVSHF